MYTIICSQNGSNSNDPQLGEAKLVARPVIEQPTHFISPSELPKPVMDSILDNGLLPKPLGEQILPPRRAAVKAAAGLKRPVRTKVARPLSGSNTPPSTVEPTRPESEDEMSEDLPLVQGRMVATSPLRDALTTPSPVADSNTTKPKKKPRRSKSMNSLPPESVEPTPTPHLFPMSVSPLSDVPDEEVAEPTEPVARLPKRKQKPIGEKSSRKRAKLAGKSKMEQSMEDLLAGDSQLRFITGNGKNWSLDKLAEWVYIRLGSGGDVTPQNGLHNNPPGYWWPARILVRDVEQRSLSAMIYDDDGYGLRRTVKTTDPSFFSVIDWTAPDHSSEFLQGDFSGRLDRKTLKARFRFARLAMQNDIGLPPVNSESVPPTPTSPAKTNIPDSQPIPPNTSRKSHQSKAYSDPRDLEEEPDGTLTIPGEVVFAREPKDKNPVFWPSRVFSFSPSDSTKQNDFPGYMVQFFPEIDEPQKVRRSYIISSIEDEFSTCKLGRWKTEVGDNHNARDPNAGTRSPTPEPVANAPLPPAPSPIDFQDLSIEEQMVFVRPFLRFIIQGKYIPALADHMGFLAGGTKRKMVAQRAGQEGGFSKGEVENIRYEVLRWALRDERRCPAENHGSSSAITEDLPDVSTEPQPGPFVATTKKQPQRPVGDGQYEELDPSDRLQYCMDILCRHALIQLLMWRDGSRRSVVQMPREEEMVAFTTAERKLAEGNWWIDVMTRRKEMLATKEREQQTAMEHTGWGRATRSARSRAW